jgi:hypothetical protein
MLKSLITSRHADVHAQFNKLYIICVFVEMISDNVRSFLVILLSFCVIVTYSVTCLTNVTV